MMKGVAIVTGGTGGIGSAICQRLAADFQVVACYFKHGKHEEAKQWQEEQKSSALISISCMEISQNLQIVKKLWP